MGDLRGFKERGTLSYIVLSVAPIRASLGLVFLVGIVALLSVSPVTPENDLTKFKHSEDLARMHEEFFIFQYLASPVNINTGHPSSANMANC